MPKNALAVVGHVGPWSSREAMSGPHALSALAALGQPMRLDIFRLLMRCEPDGVSAGTIAGEMCCPHNTLSTHLAILARAGLVNGVRNGRSIIYRANVEGMRDLISYLVEDCCDGHPDLCDFGAPKRTRDCTSCSPIDRPKRRKKP
jgi:DNA-binding transcriptional ArsR family regulator